MKRGVGKSGQMQLPFGMIFSIFLIAVFIVVAVIAITMFLNIQGNVETGSFLRDLQKEVDNLWVSSGGGEYVFERELNSKISMVCFFDVNGRITGNSEIALTFKEQTDNEGNLHNFYFYPQRGASIPSTYIEHINLKEAVKSENPYCIGKQNGKVKIKLEKGFEALVRVS